MNKQSLLLSGFLALQLLVAAGLFFGTQPGQSDHDQQLLLAFDGQKLSKIVIDSDGEEVTMLKNGADWSLPELDGLPADREKLNATLATLEELKTIWPVATTTSSHERFEVSEDKYQRRIRLYQDDKPLHELFLGTSPGFKKAHVRVAGENNVYALGLNTYDFPLQKPDWLDKGLLAAKDVTAIKGPDFELKKSDKQWQFVDSGESMEATRLNSDKATLLSQALTSFHVMSVAEEAPDFSADNVISIDVTGAKEWRYQLLEKDTKYYVKRNDREQTFTMSQHEYERLAGVSMADLKVADAEEPPAADDAGEMKEG